MISFQSFVEAINDAVQSANDALLSRHEELLHTYFEPASPAPQAGKGAAKLSTSAAAQTRGALRARSVRLEYPVQTDQGIELTEVDVPLLTLVPLSFPQIETVKFTAQFKLDMQGDEVAIDLSRGGAKPKLKAKGAAAATADAAEPETESGGTGQIEITLTPNQGTEGVRRIVEQYTKAVKAQMPH